MRHKLMLSSFPIGLAWRVCTCPTQAHAGGSPVVLRVASWIPVWDVLLHTRYTLCLFPVLVGGCGESQLEGSQMFLEKSAEIQSIIQGLCCQIKGLEGCQCGNEHGGHCAGGILWGQGTHTPSSAIMSGRRRWWAGERGTFWQDSDPGLADGARPLVGRGLGHVEGNTTGSGRGSNMKISVPVLEDSRCREGASRVRHGSISKSVIALRRTHYTLCYWHSWQIKPYVLYVMGRFSASLKFKELPQILQWGSIHRLVVPHTFLSWNLSELVY